MEWEALNAIASRHFHSLGICDKPFDSHFGGVDGALSSVVSNHFRSVVKKATREISLFSQTWTIREPDAAGRLIYECDLCSALQLRDTNGPAQVNKVTLEIGLPSTAVLSHPTSGTTLRAWMFGKVFDSKLEHGALKLHLKPIAILKDDADQQ